MLLLIDGKPGVAAMGVERERYLERRWIYRVKEAYRKVRSGKSKSVRKTLRPTGKEMP